MSSKNQIEAASGFDIKAFVQKSRADIALANPISFLLRAMSGEEFPNQTSGEKESLSLRDRVELGKHLMKYVAPQAESTDIGGGAKNVTPPSLTIVMNSSISTPQKVEALSPDDPHDHVKIKQTVIDI
jgi:hypothetical protein